MTRNLLFPFFIILIFLFPVSVIAEEEAQQAIPEETQATKPEENDLPAVTNKTSGQEDNIPWERFNLQLGVFLSAADSSIQLGTKGLGATVDPEEAFGLDTTTLAFRADGSWRFSENRRHRMDASWFSIKRDSSKILEQDIELGETTFPEGTQVATNFDFDILKVAYSYSYFQDNRFDLSVAIGTYVMPIRFSTDSTSGLLTESSDITAPLPVFGLRNDFAVTPKVFIRSNFDFFYLAYGNFKGSISDFNAAVEYRPVEHFGIGLGIETFRLKVEAKSENKDYPTSFKGTLNFNYVGALFFANFHF